jgi:hypothetical protein
VQNCAARPVTGREKMIILLHQWNNYNWLPISQRIIYKIGLITYKSRSEWFTVAPQNLSHQWIYAAHPKDSLPYHQWDYNIVNYGKRSFSYIVSNEPTVASVVDTFEHISPYIYIYMLLK